MVIIVTKPTSLGKTRKQPSAAAANQFLRGGGGSAKIGVPSLAAHSQQKIGWFGLDGALGSFPFVRRAGGERVGYWLRGIWEGETGGGGRKMGWAWAIGRAEKNCGENYAAYIILVRSPIMKERGTTGRSQNKYENMKARRLHGLLRSSVTAVAQTRRR